MLRKDLAEALNISGAMVSKLAKRGMPTHDIEAARRWRDRHLEPGRRKGMRIDTVTRSPADAAAQPAARSGAFEAALRVCELGARMLHAGQFDHVRDGVRAALRAVPVAERQHLRMDRALWDALIEDVHAVCNSAAPASQGAAGGEGPTAGTPAVDEESHMEPMSDDDAEWMGHFWMAVAAGEIVASPCRRGWVEA